jgi:tripartite-type tricarboxylate transporter receptor subunit TctC
VRIIIGFPPGGATDLVSRLMAPKYVEIFKQQFIVDNRSGANGVIGSDLAAKAAPDGHTIHLATIGTLVISPAITQVPYDPVKDFAPISQAVALQNIFIVHPTLPAKSLKEMIALAKAKPGALNFATSGQGSPGHLAGELFKSMAKVDIVHVPYKGGGPALTDLIAGHVEIFVAVISTAVPQVKAGKARALAVTGGKRVAALPDVPTVAETGIKGYEATNWYGYVAPAGTPRPIIERLHKETVAILNMPDVREALLDRGIEAAPSSPAEFAAFIRAENTKWSKVIKQSGMKGEAN